MFKQVQVSDYSRNVQNTKVRSRRKSALGFTDTSVYGHNFQSKGKKLEISPRVAR